MIRIFTAEKHRFLWDSILTSHVYILRFKKKLRGGGGGGVGGIDVPVDELNICACEGLSVLLQFRTKFLAFLIRHTSGNYGLSQHTEVVLR